MSLNIKLLTVVGARPQFIKSAIVSREIVSNRNLTEEVLHTGQHYDENMSDIFFKELSMPKPDISLSVGSLPQGAQTGKMLEGIEKSLLTGNYQGVILYGDTNSTLAGALAAVKLSIPVFHVEAGLRSYNNIMPEEINRVLTDKLSNVLFTPTARATANLMREGYSVDNVYQSGDVMYDATLFYLEKYRASVWFERFQNKHKNYLNEYTLFTCHRAENTNDEKVLREIFKKLNELSLETLIVFPIHPRTQKKIVQLGIKLSNNIVVIPPVGYGESIFLIENAIALITDSGGMQKEAYFLRTPCITLRSETEWIELIEISANFLCDPKGQMDLVGSWRKAVNQEINYDIKPYGNGNSAKSIVDKIENYFSC